jgi:hypothetical protein
MNEGDLDRLVEQVAAEVVPILRRVYDQNASRHDPIIGDDSTTFAISVYRNSWHQIEQRFNEIDGWSATRPKGSLLLTNGRVNIHVYRHGADEYVDIEKFSLEDAASSLTKQLIAYTNGNQLALDLTPHAPADAPDASRALELVVVHAGNPEDGCCGIWVGAPTTRDVPSASRWVWVRSVWQIQRAVAPAPLATTTGRERHSQMDAPDLDIGLADEIEQRHDAES